MSVAKTKRLRVWLLGDKACWLCGGPVSLGAVTMDHVVPKSRGGGNCADNLKPAHRRCNGLRGSRDPWEWDAVLEQTPELRSERKNEQQRRLEELRATMRALPMDDDFWTWAPMDRVAA